MTAPPCRHPQHCPTVLTVNGWCQIDLHPRRRHPDFPCPDYTSTTTPRPQYLVTTMPVSCKLVLPASSILRVGVNFSAPTTPVSSFPRPQHASMSPTIHLPHDAGTPPFPCAHHPGTVQTSLARPVKMPALAPGVPNSSHRRPFPCPTTPAPPTPRPLPRQHPDNCSGLPSPNSSSSYRRPRPKWPASIHLPYHAGTGNVPGPTTPAT